jgi:hypothetical protein
VSGVRRLLVLLVLGALAACNQKPTSGVSFAFERPERLEFVCFAPLKAPKQAEYVPLPAECCRVFDSTHNTVVPPIAPAQACARVGNDEVGTPGLHAVVTQSTRGEVAAVDLVKNVVLDSDRQIPGYTFLDTGGLPTAIVVPPTLPGAKQDKDGRNVIAAGPAWTYVASAEQLQVRATPTCRFRSGTTCGPDLEPANKPVPNRPANVSSYDDRLRVQLDAAPADMKLGPGLAGPDTALWVTLPELGLIARIDLAPVPIERVDFVKADGTPGTADYAKPVDAFAVVDDDATGRRPAKPVYFRVPSAPNAAPLVPVSEAEYKAICGLGYEFRAAQRKLALAPRVPLVPTSEVKPTELHFDKDSGLLLVSDRVAPVIHAFAAGNDGTLTALAALATGSPVRTFVVTPPVPVSAVDLRPVPLPPVSVPPPTKRYLYASDVDGRVAVFDFSSARVGATPSLQPLLVPTPGLGFADRIDLPRPITALEVIDTREESDYVCGQEVREALVTERDAQKVKVSAAAEADRPPLQRELDRLNGKIAIYDTAAPNYLRGVFVVAAAASGAISVIDVHDLDASCRARRECCAKEICNPAPTPPDADDLTVARTPATREAVAIRRHAVRRSLAGSIEASTSFDALVRPDACEMSTETTEAYEKLGTQPICAPADPWTQLTQTWTVRWQRALPNSLTGGAAFRLLDDAADTLEVLAPVEYQTCATGVAVGDLVAVMGRPQAAQRSANCPDPTTDSAVLLEIVKAYDDRLVVKPSQKYLDDNKLKPDEVQKRVLECYPDLAGIEIRAKDYLVVSSTNIYLHRIITAPDKECVTDESKDELLTSRLREVNDPTAKELKPLKFKNPYVEFTVADAPAGTAPKAREVSVDVREGSTGLQVSSVQVSDGVSDALPATMRYVTGVGNLFVLDTAGQGLRRYTLRPFQTSGQPPR